MGLPLLFSAMLEDPITLGYVAGMLDGEGHICRLMYIARRNGQRYYRLNVCITNTNKDVLDWMHAITGIGTVISTGHRAGKRKPCWRWQVTGRAAKMLLEILLPHLHIKADKAARAIVGPTCGPVHEVV